MNEPAFLKFIGDKGVRTLGNGCATEATRAVVTYASATLEIDKLAAITSPNNKASIRLLEKVGFCFQKKIQLP